MSEPSFFSILYPDIPGFKRDGTSKSASEAIAPRAVSIQQRVLDLLKTKTLTPDEAADALGISILAVRPRFTELSVKGLIIRTGQRRANTSGLLADVWRAV